ncbi:General transcriptional corepressor ssn6 [Grifola frondosa]|uniref:General transcriptional corepressor ssn6 n=1 Tax=Grifola frondosa TaxID=5627 RepID=A0A1C7MTF7_GRIFR|nr:General transcriptional corepressor ssn6 [Grifola frondosa]
MSDLSTVSCTIRLERIQPLRVWINKDQHEEEMDKWGRNVANFPALMREGLDGKNEPDERHIYHLSPLTPLLLPPPFPVLIAHPSRSTSSPSRSILLGAPPAPQHGSQTHPRQPERDIRLHDPHAPHHAHSLPPSNHQHPHPPHLNGNSLSNPPASIAGPPTNSRSCRINLGRVAEQMGNLEHALSAYEHALRHNPLSLSGLTQVAGIARIKENYPKAVDYFQRVLGMQQDNGEVWSALGHCYLMQDDLQKAYTAYQQALYYLPNPKDDPKLWYGIGILYDRYGSLDHAEEAFASVLKMDKDFDKANEILFRLGIIYKQQGKYTDSLDCFDRILRNPPNPLAHADIWFQIGHVFEQQRDHVRARDAYERVVHDNPSHAKVLQQLGWLYHQDGSSFQNQELAIQYLTKSLEADPADAQSWYLLGRAYMAGQKYNKAYEAYQQAVYRDGRNPTFWCSIGVLYFQINQYRDALDAYSRAIRINPYISEVWFDLGSLYESCNNQISDAIDAYARAAELDPGNTAIAQRLQLLKTAQATGGALPAAPGPQDVHPTAYANPMMPAPGLNPPMLMQPGAGGRPLFRTDSRGPQSDLPLPMPAQLASTRSSPGPFRGGPPPPLFSTKITTFPPTHHSHRWMSIASIRDRTPHSRRGRMGLEVLQGKVCFFTMLRLSNSRLRSCTVLGIHSRIPMNKGLAVPYACRRRRVSPPRSPLLRWTYTSLFQRSEAADGSCTNTTSAGPSPPPYPREEPGWDRRMPVEHLEWERRSRTNGEYPPHPQSQFYPSRPHSPPSQSRGPPSPRGPRDSPPDISPRSNHPGYSRQYWEAKQGGPSGPAVMPRRASSPRPSMQEMMHESSGRRYDPRFDAREREPPREYEREPMLDPRADPRYAASPEAIRMHNALPAAAHRWEQSHVGEPSYPKERKRRAAPKRVKEEPPRPDQPGYASQSASFKIDYRQPPKGNNSPEPVSSNGSGSASRSIQPSPTSSTHVPPSRVVDEDYDEGVADALINLASDPRAFAAPPPGARIAMWSPPVPHVHARHGSVSSRNSPPVGTKRPLSPGPDDHVEKKRSRMGSTSQSRRTPTGGRPTPTPSTRLSPIPFRQQPTSHSPDMRQPVDNSRSYPPSPSLPTMLPPHPRPIGAGGMPLPHMSTRSPPSNGTSPVEDERMHSRSASPPRGAERKIVLHTAPAGSPAGKGTSTSSPSSSTGRGPVS